MNIEKLSASETELFEDLNHVSQKRLKPVMRLLIAVAILSVGILIALYLMENRPSTHRKRPQRQATLVETTVLKSSQEQIVVQAMGTVQSAKSVDLASRVSGEIIDINPEFIPGGFIKEGENLLHIDPRDYELAVREKRSSLARAESDLKIEMGQQAVALREYELLGETVNEDDRELVLRQPQLESAKAAVASARAALEKAKLDLSRTSVSSPFNAVVQSRAVELGSQVNTGMKLATLVGIDEYWIQVSLPLDQLKWLSIPRQSDGTGSTVRIYCESAWGSDVYREGHVLRLLPDLEPEGRLARIIVSVKDPMNLDDANSNHNNLVLDSYVRVEILGISVPDVFRIPGTAVRNGQTAWILDPSSKLAIRNITILFQDTDTVLVSQGLNEGESLIISDLGAPVEGLELRTMDSPKDDGMKTGSGTNRTAQGSLES